MMMSTCPNCVAQVHHEDHLREVKCADCGHVFPTVLDEIPDDEPVVPTAASAAEQSANPSPESEPAPADDGPVPELTDDMFADNTPMSPTPVAPTADSETQPADLTETAPPEAPPEPSDEPEMPPEPDFGMPDLSPPGEEGGEAHESPFPAEPEGDAAPEPDFEMPDLSPPDSGDDSGLGEDGLPDFGAPEPPEASPPPAAEAASDADEGGMPDFSGEGEDGLPDFSPPSDDDGLPDFSPPSEEGEGPADFSPPTESEPGPEEDAPLAPNPFGELHMAPPSGDSTEGEDGGPPDFGMEPGLEATPQAPVDPVPSEEPEPTEAPSEPAMGDFDSAPDRMEPPLDTTAPFAESANAFEEIRQFGENLGTTPEAPPTTPAASPAGQSQPAPDVANLPLTSGDSLVGYTLEEYLSPVSATSEFAEGDNPLRAAFTTLLTQAKQQGGNGVVAVRWSVLEGGKKVLVSGTAVKCTKKS